MAYVVLMLPQAKILIFLEIKDDSILIQKVLHAIQEKYVLEVILTD